MFLDSVNCLILVSGIFFLFSSIGFSILKIFSNNHYNYIYSYFIGKSIFILNLNFLYIFFNFSLLATNLIFIFFSTISLLFFIKKENQFLLKLLKIFVKFYLPIILILIFVGFFYGTNFYVFRGNHWDWLSQISMGKVFNEYNYKEFLKIAEFEFSRNIAPIENQIGIPFEKSYYFFPFLGIEWGQRLLPSLLMGSIFLFKSVDIFLLAYCLKILIFSSFFAGFYLFLNSFKKTILKLNTYLIALVFTLSTWSFYLFEIDALAQLIVYPLSLIFFSYVLRIFLDFDKNQKTIVLLSIISSSIFLSYPEQAVVIFFSTIIFFLIFKRDIFFIKFFYLALVIFFIFTSSELFKYFSLALNMSTATNNWWGYFGSYILGKENLASNVDVANQIKKIIYDKQMNILTIIQYIYKLHIQNGFSLLPLTILPSAVGFYFISNAEFSYFNLLYLVIINLLIIYFLLKNIIYFYQNKNLEIKFIKFNILIGIFLIMLFLIKNQLYISIKLIYYFSPFFLIFIFLKWNNTVQINYLFLIIIFIFPIYKYSDFNFGNMRKDSFPSSLNRNLKKDLSFNIDKKKINNCDFVLNKVNQQVPNIYVSLMLDHFQIANFNETVFASSAKNQNNFDKKTVCKIEIKNKNFEINNF